MTSTDFNTRYPHRLLKLAERAMFTVSDGVPQVYTGGTKGRSLRLRAFYESEDEGGTQTYVVRVVLDRSQTERSLMHILMAMFDQDNALKVRAAWDEVLYPDYDIISLPVMRVRKAAGLPLIIRQEEPEVVS